MRPRRAGRAAAGSAPRSGGWCRHHGGARRRARRSRRRSRPVAAAATGSTQGPWQFARRALASGSFRRARPETASGPRRRCGRQGRAATDSIASRRLRIRPPNEPFIDTSRTLSRTSVCDSRCSARSAAAAMTLNGSRHRAPSPACSGLPVRAARSTRRRAGCCERARSAASSACTPCERTAEQLAGPHDLRMARRTRPQREAAGGLRAAGPAALLQPALGAARVPQLRSRTQGAPDQGRRRGLGVRRRRRLVDARDPPARGLRPRTHGEGARERARLRRPRGAGRRGRRSPSARSGSCGGAPSALGGSGAPRPRSRTHGRGA